jgi:hypothetical protein
MVTEAPLQRLKPDCRSRSVFINRIEIIFKKTSNHLPSIRHIIIDIIFMMSAVSILMYIWHIDWTRQGCATLFAWGGGGKLKTSSYVL